MKLSGWLVLAVVLLVASDAAHAEERNVLAPFRYQPPPQQLAPLDQEKAFAYRSKVDSQLRSLELDDAHGRLNSFDQRLLLDTRTEFTRMNTLLGY